MGSCLQQQQQQQEEGWAPVGPRLPATAGRQLPVMGSGLQQQQQQQRQRQLQQEGWAAAGGRMEGAGSSGQWRGSRAAVGLVGKAQACGGAGGSLLW
jgi:hypothetical protein